MSDRFVRHWRILWTPWGSLFIGRHNGKPSLWTEPRRGDFIYIDVWWGP